MPIIPPPESALPSLAIIVLQAGGSGQLEATSGLRSHIQIIAGGSGQLGALVEGITGFEFIATGGGYLRKNLEADTFGSADIQITASGSGAINKALTSPIHFQIRASGGGQLTRREADVDEIRYVIDIVPPPVASHYKYQHWRLTVDGVVLPVRDFTYRSEKGRIGEELTVTLADYTQRSLITSASSVKFEIGKEWNGIWSNLTVLMEFAEVKQSNFSLTELGLDTFNFSSVGALAAKLNKCPETDLVIYDSAKMTLNAVDFDILTDNYGRSYVTELEPKSNFKLYDLFEEVFIDRCGFTGFNTNLPSYSLSRIDCKLGVSYLDSIGGFFGYCDPDIDVIGDEIQVMDSSYIHPEGSPEPRSISSSDWSTTKINSNLQLVDAIRLSYTEDKRNFDYYTVKVETSTRSLTQSSDQRQSEESVEKRIREYRKYSNPFAVIKRETENEERVTRTDGIMISRVNESFSYDDFGRLTAREKVTEALLPTFSTLILDVVLSFQTVGREYETVEYKAHPFQSRLQYIASRTVQKYQVVVEDVDVEIGGSVDGVFVAGINNEYRAGNLKEGVIVHLNRHMETIQETAFPLRGGLVKVEHIHIDHLNDLVLEKYEEERPGDVSISGFAPDRQEKLIFRTETDVRTARHVVNLDVGELPLVHGEPFAQRYLIRLQDKPDRINMNVIGYEPIYRKGTPFAAKDGAISLGNFMCESVQIQGSSDTGVINTSLAGRQI